MSVGVALAVIECLAIGLPELRKIIENICNTMNVRSQERSGVVNSKSREEMTGPELAEADLEELCDRFEELQLNLNYAINEGCNDKEAEDLKQKFELLKIDVQKYCEQHPEAKAGKALHKSVQFGQTVIDAQMQSNPEFGVAELNLVTNEKSAIQLGSGDHGVGGTVGAADGYNRSDDASDDRTHLFTQ